MAGNQAAFLDGAGQKLRVASADIPHPSSREIVIRNRAAAVNPIDWKVQDHGLMVREWPTVLGMDVAGEVFEVGKDVGDEFRKGDRVFARLIAMHAPDNHHAAFQLFSVAEVVTTAKIPDSLSFAQAAVLPVAFDTALIGLSGEAGRGLGLPPPSLDPKPNGKVVVVWGGSSSVGALSIQIAAAAGMKVITTSSKHNFEFCKKCGANEVFDYSDSSVVEKIVNAVRVSGAEFGGVFDCVSVDSSYRASVTIAERLGGGGVIVTLPGLPEPPAGVTTTPVFGLGPFTHPFWRDHITPALETGKLQCLPDPLVVGKGLENLQDAFDVQKKGVSAKKIVVSL